jgi:hypothetical protein
MSWWTDLWGGNEGSNTGNTQALMTPPVFGSDTFSLVAGDYVDFRVYQNQGSNKGSASVTHSFAVERIGN